MSSVGLTVYGPDVARSGLTAPLDDFIHQRTNLEIAERFFLVHSRTSIGAFYSLTNSTSGKYWPLVLDLFDMRPACATVWEGADALERLINLKGNTQPARAAAGTVRSLFCCDNPVTNLIHVSDSGEIMARELTVLRRRFTGDADPGWRALSSGRISHSSFHVLLNVLGEEQPLALADGLRPGDAAHNAQLCYNQALLLSSRADLFSAVQRYLQGEHSGLESLVRRFSPFSAWDRLVLEAGLFAMPSWNETLATSTSESKRGQ
ncbi:nucleoside-diphosphate kinase [Sinorhizobium americanum]|uniref:nucleoside-diphosphate kinase n=1 Tax=Sinorhizobium americanum TaxID=194963 RepID=UPI00055C8EA1|nr:nucleoside-diphosphate kinase [Sinorhizobium americanum]